MVQLEFHTGIADALDYSCRCCARPTGAARAWWCAASPRRLSRLDVQLWTFEQLEFIPHLRVRAGDEPSAGAASARRSGWSMPTSPGRRPTW